MCSACTCCGCFHYVGSHPPHLDSPPPPPKKTTHPPPPTHPPTHTWLCRLMDSLEIFTQVPVDPDSYYLVGLQVYGVPGFDFLSPIGTSGVTIAAALNPCVGG